MKNSQKTAGRALAELGAELGISEADFGGKLQIEGKDPVVASRHHLGESTAVLLALFGMELAAIWRQRNGASKLEWSVSTRSVPELTVTEEVRELTTA